MVRGTAVGSSADGAPPLLTSDSPPGGRFNRHFEGTSQIMMTSYRNRRLPEDDAEWSTERWVANTLSIDLRAEPISGLRYMPRILPRFTARSEKDPIKGPSIHDQCSK
jgi:hypothetical protein